MRTRRPRRNFAARTSEVRVPPRHWTRGGTGPLWRASVRRGRARARARQQRAALSRPRPPRGRVAAPPCPKAAHRCGRARHIRWWAVQARRAAPHRSARAWGGQEPWNSTRRAARTSGEAPRPLVASLQRAQEGGGQNVRRRRAAAADVKGAQRSASRRAQKG
ncbi:MAG: hypothetical protein J3K34DRAFT_237044 [Monoraphidium minutum]|nr:MAG: hypothetical protein J3K34DRAFT_237044 [Monoraphidium minutum]